MVLYVTNNIAEWAYQFLINCILKYWKLNFMCHEQCEIKTSVYWSLRNIMVSNSTEFVPQEKLEKFWKIRLAEFSKKWEKLWFIFLRWTSNWVYISTDIIEMFEKLLFPKYLAPKSLKTASYKIAKSV